MIRSAVLLYHEAQLHDRDLHSLCSAVLLYHGLLFCAIHLAIMLRTC